MKFIILLVMTTLSFAWSARVPISDFDQSKIEQLLSRIPETFLKEEDMGNFIRKRYVFPKNKSVVGLKINCFADYYGSSAVPSQRKCDVHLSDELIHQTDLAAVRILNPEIVTQLFQAMSYGSDEKKLYSTEIFQAVNLDGISRDTFRYSIICDKKTCELKFVLQ